MCLHRHYSAAHQFTPLAMRVASGFTPASPLSRLPAPDGLPARCCDQPRACASAAKSSATTAISTGREDSASPLTGKARAPCRRWQRNGFFGVGKESLATPPRPSLGEIISRMVSGMAVSIPVSSGFCPPMRPDNEARPRQVPFGGGKPPAQPFAHQHGRAIKADRAAIHTAAADDGIFVRLDANHGLQ